ncbi:MAG TPA: CBS domain-containing protein [Candidatus Binatia bacterium]|jgi:CBS domain-containing protein|nr:CBS domain-containing protein [Candidatus Binatia bacterium]
MQLREVMTRKVEVVHPESTLVEAAEKMSDLDVGPMPVCDGDRLVGMITDRDIAVRAIAKGYDPAKTPVKEAMTPEVLYCFEDQKVEEAATVMQQNQIRRLLVLNRSKQLVGIVSLGDLAISTDERLSGETLERISEQGGSMAAQSIQRDRTDKNRLVQRDLTGRKTVAGLFRDRESAQRAIDDLKEAGFTRDQVGVAMRDRTGEVQSTGEKGTHAAEGAVTGAVGGGVLGGLAGYLIATGALMIPGVGPVVAAGALTSALGIVGGTTAVGAGIGAAAGGLGGALVGMGIPEEEARHFETGFRAGEVLVTVKAGDRIMEAFAILEMNDADTGLGRAPKTS